MSKYTKEDFANAEFARHPDGRIAARLYPRLKEQWAMFESAWGSSDHQLVIDGWMPISNQVPGRTITMPVSEWAEEVALMDNRPDRILMFLGKFIDFHVTPDPEPTNVEKLIQDLTGVMAANLSYGHKSAIASALVERGWMKAPGGDDD